MSCMALTFSPFQFAGSAYVAKTRWRLFLLISQLSSLIITTRHEYFTHIAKSFAFSVIITSYLGTYGNSHWARNAEARFESGF